MAARGYEFIAGSDKPFQCKACEKAFVSEGAWKLHKPCGSAYGTRHKAKEKPAAKSPAQGCACGGGLRLLRVSEPVEKAAVAQGFGSVCIKCGELY